MRARVRARLSRDELPAVAVLGLEDKTVRITRGARDLLAVSSRCERASALLSDGF